MRAVRHRGACRVRYRDPDQAASARIRFDPNIGGTCVERVFEKFFDYGGGALYDFSGGNFIRYCVGEYSDAAHT